MKDKTLLDSMNEDIGNATLLLELIEAEFKALSERRLADLEKVLADKQPLLAFLSQNAGTRNKLLTSLNLTPDKDGMEKLAAASTLGDELRTAMQKLAAILDDCQTKNLRNGRLIRASHASTKSVLGILRGGAEIPNLYDSSGSTARIQQRRPLSQA